MFGDDPSPLVMIERSVHCAKRGQADALTCMVGLRRPTKTGGLTTCHGDKERSVNYERLRVLRKAMRMQCE